jgi:formylglycine-generating enzyme required for sulfatase activity
MLKPGELLGGDFEIVRPLGGGGMGMVFLARQRSTGAFRAVKVMLPEYSDHGELARRFAQEAKACGRIQSDHVVKTLLYGVDTERNMPWLVMEYLPGETLEKRVERLGVPPAPERVQILEQLFHGVIAAHRAGVVHRDLKPPNIYIAEPQRPGVPFTIKVLDFGIAKLLSESRLATQAMGTRAWMAPEQESSGAIITPAADVWALGLVVFWLCTGSEFWLNVATTPARLSYEIFYEDIPSWSQRVTQLRGSTRIDPALDAWFARCLQRDPTWRFPSAEQCWAALNPHLKRLVSFDDLALSGGATELPHRRVSTAPPSSDGTLSAERPLHTPSSGALLVALPYLSPRTTSPTFLDRPPQRSRPKDLNRGFLAMGAVVLTGVTVASFVSGLLPLPRVSGRTPQVASAAAIRLVARVGSEAAPEPPSASVDANALHQSLAPIGMVYVPPSSFTMGFDNGQKKHRPHRVTISHGFFIDMTEATVRDYLACVRAHECTPNTIHGPARSLEELGKLSHYCNQFEERERLDDPVNCIDREQAAAFCHFAGKRLPTEAEWEYAARGSDDRAYPWGNEPPTRCDMSVVPGLCRHTQGTSPAGSRSPSSKSPFGALDMSGNVWEWVQDAFDENTYQQDDVTDPVEIANSTHGVLRGGGWDYAPGNAHIAYRLPFDHREGNVATGVRCLKETR